MLIIFDLDDTLIDTSGSIIPFKLKLCLQRLEKMGLDMPEPEIAYKELLELNARCLRSLDALKEFITKRGGDPDWISELKEDLFSPLPEDFFIPTTPYAKEILKELSSQHELALVTVGYPPFQREKLKKAGIEPGLFGNILIPGGCIKRSSYAALRRQ